MARKICHALGLGGGNPNILWITLTIGDAAYFVASVYLPDNSKDKEADEVAEQLINDIGDIPGEAFIIIMGDWNYDPFRAKGKNKDAFKKIMSHPRMALVHNIFQHVLSEYPTAQAYPLRPCDSGAQLRGGGQEKKAEDNGAPVRYGTSEGMR